MPKGVYPHTHIKPREYPQDIVDLVRHLYLDEFLTVREVQDRLPRGYKAQRIIERYIPERRRAIKRDQRGPNNDSWRGDQATYAAVHLRLQTIRGSARDYTCCTCGGPAAEWSYTGNAPDERRTPRGPYTTNLNHYVPRCISCHRSFDRRQNRKEGDADVQ